MAGHESRLLRPRRHAPKSPDAFDDSDSPQTDDSDMTYADTCAVYYSIPPHPTMGERLTSEDDHLPAVQYIDGKIRVYETPGKSLTKKERRRSEDVWSRLLMCSVMPWLCSLTRTLGVCWMVQACHFVPRNWSWHRRELMTSVEYCLGFTRPWTLNLDTRWNIWALSVTYHFGFDHGAFGLLPTLQCLLALLIFVKNNVTLSLRKRRFFKTHFTPPDGARHWKYDFLAFHLPESHSIPVNTPYKDEYDSWMNDPAQWRFETHPYHGIGQIECHVHPFFVILNTYDKIEKYGIQPFWTPDQRMRTVLVQRLVEAIASAPVEEFVNLLPAPQRSSLRSARSVTPPLEERPPPSKKSALKVTTILFPSATPRSEDDQPVAGPSTVKLEDLPPTRTRKPAMTAPKRQHEQVELNPNAPAKKRRRTNESKDVDTAISSRHGPVNGDSSRPRTRSSTAKPTR